MFSLIVFFKDMTLNTKLLTGSICIMLSAVERKSVTVNFCIQSENVLLPLKNPLGPVQHARNMLIK